MKPLALLTSLTLLTSSLSFAASESWMHDFEAAKKKALAEKKDLLVDFTGSDWCHWCIKLDEEVFQHDSFEKGASDQYVLVEIDFPKDQSKQSAETIAQNKKLQDLYSIQGFPSILLLDPQGRPYAQTGYQPGGPEAYLSHLAELQKQKEARDEALAKASEAKGVEKAKALIAVLNSVPEGQAVHYGDLTEEILKNDPEDVTGFAAAKATNDKLSQLETAISTAMQAKKSDEAIAAIDDFLKENDVEVEQHQQILGAKINVLLSEKNLAEAEKVINEVIALSPTTQSGQNAASFKPQLEKLKAQAKAEAEAKSE